MNAKQAMQAIKNGAIIEIYGKNFTPAKWTMKSGVIFTQTEILDACAYYARFDKTQASTQAHFKKMQNDGLKFRIVNDNFLTTADCYIKRTEPTKKQFEKLISLSK